MLNFGAVEKYFKLLRGITNDVTIYAGTALIMVFGSFAMYLTVLKVYYEKKLIEDSFITVWYHYVEVQHFIKFHCTINPLKKLRRLANDK